MHSKLVALRQMIGKVEGIEEIFAQHGACVLCKEVCQSPSVYAGLETLARNSFILSWSLSLEINRATLRVSLSWGEGANRLIGVTCTQIVSSGDIEDVWRAESVVTTTDEVRNLAANCGLGSGEPRNISAGEACRIVYALAAFYAKQPAA